MIFVRQDSNALLAAQGANFVVELRKRVKFYPTPEYYDRVAINIQYEV